MSTRGNLRIYLGAAPGVGKTHAMLEEGISLRAAGVDVVVGWVESYGRLQITDLLRRLEVVAPRRSDGCQEMDLRRMLERRPQVALIDELAHTNAPWSEHSKRWEDVEALLCAGIDVVTTLNIEHLETLTDVVAEITGVTQDQTIPDQVVRQADEIELVDVTKETIRERLAEGKICPPEQLDAARANYFRPGNLDALRELALLWTADRVEETLRRYRRAHGIEDRWETRERVVVALAGAPGGEAIVRRAARMAQRSRGDLIGVHIRSAHPVNGMGSEALDGQRRLLLDLGGTYHEVIGDDVGRSLVSFARAEEATQLILGASRRTRWNELLRGSVIKRVIRDSGSTDVHVISYPASERARGRSYRRRRRLQPLPSRRQLLGWALAGIALPVLTAGLLELGDQVELQNVLLLYLLAAVAVATVGGTFPALATAIAGFLLGNWFFTSPLRTWTIAEGQDLVALVVFLLVAGVVGVLVGVAARKSADAARAGAEAATLASLAGSVSFDQDGLIGLLDRLRTTFAVDGAAVLSRVEGKWEVEAGAGEPVPQDPEEGHSVLLREDSALVLRGSELSAGDRMVLRAFASHFSAVLERRRLEQEAEAAQAMAAADRLRTSLLRAVSHDLRTPLSSIIAAATSLLQEDVRWPEKVARGFLEAIGTEATRLNGLVGNLLDASRIQAGVVQVFLRRVSLEEVVGSALTGIGDRRVRVVIDVPEFLPDVETDPALLERVVANLVENALRWNGQGADVRVEAGEVAGRVDLRVIDRGPGIPPEDREAIFQPFQRLADSRDGGGVGLGLAVARGFLEAMGHSLDVEDTPGGGTTMVIGVKVTP